MMRSNENEEENIVIYYYISDALLTRWILLWVGAELQICRGICQKERRRNKKYDEILKKAFQKFQVIWNAKNRTMKVAHSIKLKIGLCWLWYPLF